MINKQYTVNLFKESLDFPCPTHVSINAQSIKRVVDLLKPFVACKTNVRIDPKAKHRIFISDLISFCKLEGLDYSNIIALEVVGIFPEEGYIQVIVSPGNNEDVNVLTI